MDLKAEDSNFSRFLNEICDTVVDTDKLMKISFLCEQLKLTVSKKHGERYTGYIMKESMDIFLKSRNAYNSLRELLILPHKNTIMGYFGKLGTTQSIHDCTTVVTNVKLGTTQSIHDCTTVVTNVKLGTTQSIHDCTTVVTNVISKLSGVERHCKILCDEIQI